MYLRESATQLRILIDPSKTSLVAMVLKKIKKKSFIENILLTILFVLIVNIIAELYFKPLGKGISISILEFFLLFIFYWMIVFYLHNFKLNQDIIDRIYLKIGPLVTVFLFSATITSLAILLSNFFAFKDNELYWFIIKGSRIFYKHNFLIIIINFIFDFLTIIVSLKLIYFILKKKYNIEVIALMDMLLSALLTILLLSTFKIIEIGNISKIINCLSDSTLFFISVITFQISKIHPDFPLIPLLFTTFIPVTFYMLIFIIFGFVIKPLLRISGYFCGLIFEKEKSPFFQFSFILSLIVTFLKALSEWDWFVFHINKVLSIK